jgi:LPS sulfotransferase NodH
MKDTTLLSSLVVATMLIGAPSAFAQGQRGGQQGGQQQMQQQRQSAPAASRDRTMDAQRLQTRDQAQNRTPAHARDQSQVRQHAATGSGDGIYGGNLMTEQERSQYRERLGGLKTEQERAEFTARHQKQMQLRAKQRGIEPEITSD